MRVAFGRWLCVIAVVLAALVPTTASAQDLPPPPAEIPPAPEPIPGTLEETLDTIGPPANDVATQLAPVATATGFAFRPGCSTVGTAMVALVLAGAYIPAPVSFGQVVGPLLVYCAYTYAAGPFDPVFAQADAAVAPTFDDQVTPLMKQVYDAAEPVRSQLIDACGYSPLLAAPLASLPAPLSRIDLVRVVCG